MKFHFLLPIILFLSCKQESVENANTAPAPATTLKTIGKIERMSPELDSILAADVKIEVLADGFTWSEGPVWMANMNCLLFTDVPENKIFKWKEGEGVRLYLDKAGFTGEKTDSPEPGANGLATNGRGILAMCQHGDRRVVRLSDDPKDPKTSYFEIIADQWNGKRFNSPNDLCYDKGFNVYFTDPPYGLKGHDKSPEKEIPFQGVFRRTLEGTVELLDSTLSRPNGIALTPDEMTLFVSNSDPKKAIWKAYDFKGDRTLTNPRIFHDATSMVSDSLKGLPDGLKISKKGIIFATGPGGVLIFKQDGTLLGRINPGEATANCAFGKDEKVLYMTSDMYLCRVTLK
jgi:gluconolactonase